MMFILRFVAKQRFSLTPVQLWFFSGFVTGLPNTTPGPGPTLADPDPDPLGPGLALALAIFRKSSNIDEII